MKRRDEDLNMDSLAQDVNDCKRGERPDFAEVARTPTAYAIIDIPQKTHTAYGAMLHYADGTTGQIGVSSRSKRGVRQIMRRHRAFGTLPERIVSETPVARMSDAGVLGSGPYHLAPMRRLVATVRPIEEGERL